MSKFTPDLCSKAEIRRFVRSKVDSLTEEAKLRETNSLRRQVFQLVKQHLKQFSKAKLFGFMALSHEPSWLRHETLEEWGLPICVPRVVGAKMEFVLVDSTMSWKAGAFHIQEPISSVVITPCADDLMIVPCLAITVDGHRLGHGQGFFDKYLAGLENQPNTVGITFSPGIFPEVKWPLEAHDVRLKKALVP